MNGPSALDRLAAAKGLVTRFRDINGRTHVAGPDTQRALLAAMGIDTTNEQAIELALADHARREATRPVPRYLVGRPNQPLSLRLAGPQEWRLLREDGNIEEGGPDESLRLTLPAGLHRLLVQQASCLLIIAPTTAPRLDDLIGRPRGWGVMAALYGLRSQDRGGIGDYDTLGRAAAALAGLGADFLGINPIHARGAAHDGYSPYSPSSRIALEPGHVAPSNPLATTVLADDLIDYAADRAERETALRREFDAFMTEAGDSRRQFDSWWNESRAHLEPFARFEALSLHMGEDWRRWPDAYRDPGGPAVSAFAVQHETDVLHHAWLQWRAHGQLAAAQDRARASGMPLGLYLDLAVGVRPDGADCWCWPDAFARGVSLGAPPDDFNPRGQTWNLAPFSPEGLIASEFAPFIAVLRAAMSHAGMIRIDHVLGLFRTYWVPDDGAPGGYVNYPTDALMALTILEAHRARCVVVGEDLGTVPESFRDRLSAAGLLGCAVLQFEQREGVFRSPGTYREHSLASFGSHDTPTLRGWRRERDIDWRLRSGQIDEDGASASRDQRKRERQALTSLLIREKLMPDGTDPGNGDDEDYSMAVHTLLAEARSSLVAVTLDDGLGLVEQPNLPGTVAEHPNWRRPCPVAVEDLTRQTHLRNIADLLNASRKNTTGKTDRTTS